MRIIGELDTEKKAYTFYSFLLKEGVKGTYEAVSDSQYRIWVDEEDDLPKALEWFEKFQENPDDPVFKDVALSPLIIANESEKHTSSKKNYGWKIKVELKPLETRFTLTKFLVLFCVFIFILNAFQEKQIEKEHGSIPVDVGMGVTKVQQEMFFDYPAAFQEVNERILALPLQDYKNVKMLPPQDKALLESSAHVKMWRGVYDYLESPKEEHIPTFEKIKQGQVWRLFTPCLLHISFFHILFNMAWLWILGKQVEERLSKGRFILFMLIAGVISNVAQYLVSGPFFLGFSGIVVAMVGFIWMRQKVAPWEGYPLQKSTVLFILIFVLAMFGLELASFLLQVFKITDRSANIANTAHIVGGLVGMLLGRIPFFARRSK